MRLAAGLALAVAASIAPAVAQMPLGGARNFPEGVLSPLLTPAHALAVLGTGLLLGQQKAGGDWPLAASYAAGLTAGFAAMVAAVSPALAAEALLASTALTGALVALARPLPRLAGCALALASGAALALDSSPGGIRVAQANITLAGTFCGALILLLAIARATALLRRDWQGIAVRVVGSWIAASAVLVLAARLAR